MNPRVVRPGLSDEEVRRRAYHEAGHVIEAWERGFTVTHCTVESGIDEEDEEPYDGRTISAAWNPPYSSREIELDSFLTGEIAESLGTGRGVHNSGEYEEGRCFATKEGLSFEEAEFRVRQLLERRWPCVDIVAQALMVERTVDEARLREHQDRCQNDR